MLTILKKDFKLLFNIKKLVLSSAAFLLILLLFSTVFKDYMVEKRLVEQMSVGIVDTEDSLLSGMLIENFRSNKEFSSLFTITVDSEEALKKAFDENTLSAIIFIPEGFTASLKKFENAPLKMILNANYPLQNTVLESIMSSYSDYIKAVDVGIYSLYKVLKNESVDKTTLTEINKNFSVNMVVTALNRNKLFDYQPLETFPSATSSHYFIFAIILLMIIFKATSGASVLVYERQHFCLQRYKSTSKSLLPFILSKTLVVYLNQILLILPLLFLIKLINSNLSIKSLVMLFGFLSLVVFFFIVLSMTIGLLFHKKDLSLLFSSMATLILGILGGCFLPIQLMPKVVQDISSFTPNYWMLRACLYLNQNLYTQELLTTSFLIFGATILLFYVQTMTLSRSSL